MALSRTVALLSAAALRASAQGPNIRNGDPMPAGAPFTDEVKHALFHSDGHKVQWVFALDFGDCDKACGELHCAEDMFPKVNSQHAFEAILESIDNAPGCNSFKVDTEYGVAPFIWEDEAQCWVSGESTGTTCGQEPDPQFTDVRLCPCKKEAGKDVAREATEALESSPEDEEEALSLGKEKALQGLHEVRSTSAFSEVPTTRMVVSVAAMFAVVSVAGMIGIAAFRARREEGRARLLAVAADEGEESAAPSIEC